MTPFVPIALCCALLLPSCATIVSGGPDMVPIDSVPQGAEVLLGGAPMGRTPVMVMIGRKDHRGIVLRLDGYHDQPVIVEQSVNGWIFGNILFGGLIGLVVDVGTGNARRRDESPLCVPLTPLTDPAPAAWRRPKPPRKQYDTTEVW